LDGDATYIGHWTQVEQAHLTAYTAVATFCRKGAWVTRQSLGLAIFMALVAHASLVAQEVEGYAAPVGISLSRGSPPPGQGSFSVGPNQLAPSDLDILTDRSTGDKPLLVPITGRPAPPHESFHWKGALLQSLSFDLLQNGVRIITANGSDRDILLKKPFWHDYGSSLQHYNWRRWNDGDSIKVNYIGHPLQGAISGYIEVQNSPVDRELRFSVSRAYFTSRSHAFLWTAAYSTAWELAPIGEAGIFNTGGYTYGIRCKTEAACNSPTATYTNNTGWVDFIITPVLGTALLILEDYVDTLTDRLVESHPGALKFKLLRAGANPPRSLANVLRGRYPWYRDYESPLEWESTMDERFERALAREPHEHVSIFPHYTQVSLRTNRSNCFGCKSTASGYGLESDIRILPYLDLAIDGSYLPNASALPSPDIGGNLLLVNFGLRSGFEGRRLAVKFTLAPGFASYSDALPVALPGTQQSAVRRVTNSQVAASMGFEVKPSRSVSFRFTVENRLIRYKSSHFDPPGIGTPPNLSFLSHDNFINSTNWGLRVGPVFSF
jgi:hypothetical protein